MTANTSPRIPLIAIIGSTGTGKSNLAVSIAQHLTTSKHDGSDLAAEIVNADAMQLYKGLPIITNKMSEQEQESIPHHLLGTIPLDEEPWTVNTFVKQADDTIESIVARGRVPIVVGGTGYYVHGLLLGGSLLDTTDTGENASEHNDSHGANDVNESDEMRKFHPILDATTEEIYAKLQEVDPLMATRWHPNDRRKIQRSLEIWLKTGKRASDVYAQQQQQYNQIIPKDGLDDLNPSDFHTQLRYNPLIFWLDAEDSALKERLNKRVDTMLYNGLMDEARELAQLDRRMADSGAPPDKSKGIWASIGYKELQPLLDHEIELDSQQLINVSTSLKDSCIEAIRAGTRRYAKRQNRYIRLRFAKALAEARASQNLFLLDCTDLALWNDNVESLALDIVDKFLTDNDLPKPDSLSERARVMFTHLTTENEDDSKQFARRCESCNKILMTHQQWEKHITSKSHKKTVGALRRRSTHEANTFVARSAAPGKEV